MKRTLWHFKNLLYYKIYYTIKKGNDDKARLNSIKIFSKY